MSTLMINALCNEESRSAARELKKKNPNTDYIETLEMGREFAKTNWLFKKLGQKSLMDRPYEI